MLLLDEVKTALRVTEDVFNDRIESLINVARADLARAGITEAAADDPLVKEAIITYCRATFGTPADAARMLEIYKQQRQTLAMSTGYTDWGR